jgi:hypothetical protein
VTSYDTGYLHGAIVQDEVLDLTEANGMRFIAVLFRDCEFLPPKRPESVRFERCSFIGCTFETTRPRVDVIDCSFPAMAFEDPDLSRR